jgi:hypothetical protein
MRLSGKRFIAASLIVIVAVFTIAGCAERRFTYPGGKVTRPNLIVQLKDGNQQGVWKTDALAIKYQYEMAPETLKISGAIELLGGFAIGFNYISRIAVYLLFLDDQGNVVDNSLIYAGENNLSVPIPMGFEKTIPLPDGVRTISFYYDVSFAQQK